MLAARHVDNLLLWTSSWSRRRFLVLKFTRLFFQDVVQRFVDVPLFHDFLKREKTNTRLASVGWSLLRAIRRTSRGCRFHCGALDSAPFLIGLLFSDSIERWLPSGILDEPRLPLTGTARLGSSLPYRPTAPLPSRLTT